MFITAFTRARHLSLSWDFSVDECTVIKMKSYQRPLNTIYDILSLRNSIFLTAGTIVWCTKILFPTDNLLFFPIKNYNNLLLQCLFVPTNLLFFVCFFVSFLQNCPTRTRATSCSRSVYRTQWHTTVGRILLDEGSARRTDLYLTIHNTQKRQISMPPAGFEPVVPASKRL